MNHLRWTATAPRCADAAAPTDVTRTGSAIRSFARAVTGFRGRPAFVFR